jgi:hypothetical protein
MTARCHQHEHKDRRSPVDVLAAEVRLLVARWQLTTAIGREAEECDNNVLMAYGRCLRPALYSSLRSSPSHPTGVSALRVTIAIANARKQWGLRKWTARSRRLFRNESVTSRRVLSQIAASAESLLAWKLSPGNQRPERWRDKRPQCAARSVGCCCFRFLLIRQCAPWARNVCLTINSLRGLCISHIAGAGDG